MTICGKCGTANADGADDCSWCGAALTGPQPRSDSERLRVALLGLTVSLLLIPFALPVGLILGSVTAGVGWAGLMLLAASTSWRELRRLAAGTAERE